MGQAAGTAAALSARLSVLPRRLDPGILRQALTHQGVDLDATERPEAGWSTDLDLDPDSEEAWEVPGKHSV